MAEQDSTGGLRADHPTADKRLPQTRAELRAWVHERLDVADPIKHQLLDAVDSVCLRNERLWQQSKQEAIHALAAGFAEQMARVRNELSARDATASSISRYFEALVADLTDRSHRDPKTKLMNFARFTDQLESFLALEQRGRWSAVGLADITGFKAYNDRLGHAVGDRIIERVAQLLGEHVRSHDLLARERTGRSPHGARSADLHARFGGDEFCFLLPALAKCEAARVVGERFREAVESYDWTQEDPGLTQPVRVDVGVVCVWLGPLAERRFIARQLAAALVQRADQMMYEAKASHAHHVLLARVAIRGRALVEIANDVLHS